VGLSEQEVSEYWDGNSAVWVDQVRKGYDVYREALNNPSMFRLIGNIDGKQVLDAGCGEGHNTRKLATLGAKVAGIDLSAKMIQLAQEEEKLHPLGISYVKGSFTRMPMFANCQFDMVVAFMSLMDGPNYEEMIREFHRVLKPTGQIVFSISHPCFLLEGLTWIKDENGVPNRLSIGNYFAQEPYVDKRKFTLSPDVDKIPEFQVPYFPRTLSGFINPLIDEGFHLKKLIEPRPTEDDCKANPALEKWSKHAAIFLQIKAQKA
jgi:ubiquinone/menaquinone biosynthesis C-methylase UbiE